MPQCEAAAARRARRALVGRRGRVRGGVGAAGPIPALGCDGVRGEPLPVGFPAAARNALSRIASVLLISISAGVEGWWMRASEGTWGL